MTSADDTLISLAPKDDHHVWTVLLNRPERRNALTRDQLERLPQLIKDIEAEGARALVIGAVGSCFCAGMDFDELVGTAEDAWADDVLAQLHECISNVGVPVLGAVDGPCIGAGLDLVLACDLIIAGADARFALPAARMGLLYRSEVIHALVNRIGPGAAAQLLVFGQELSAAEGVQRQLVTEVVEAGQAVKAAWGAAERLHDAPREAVAATKHLIRALAAAPAEPEGWGIVRGLLDESLERAAALERAKAAHPSLRTALPDARPDHDPSGDHA